MLKKILIILLFPVLLSFSASAQFFHNTVVKIRPLKALCILHPNIGFEKPIHRNFSLTTELAYKTTCLYNNGYEWFGSAGCKGGELYFGARGYWGKVNKYLIDYDQKAPFGWYGEVQLAYKGFFIKNYEVGDWDPNFPYFEDVTVNDIISYFLIGYQFNTKNRVTFDLNIGFNYHWLKRYRHDIVSVGKNPDDTEQEGLHPGDVLIDNDHRFGLAARFMFGYYIRFKNPQ